MRPIYLGFTASGGAERLIVDAAVELASRGHDVHIFTAHHDKDRCFDETKDGNSLNILHDCLSYVGFSNKCFRPIFLSGKLPVTVYGDFLPRHVFYRLHALCAYMRCVYVALCMIWFWKTFDIILADQVSAVIPVFKMTSSKVNLWFSSNMNRLCSLSSRFLVIVGKNNVHSDNLLSFVGTNTLETSKIYEWNLFWIWNVTLCRHFSISSTSSTTCVCL
jgi:hypothetical protein